MIHRWTPLFACWPKRYLDVNRIPPDFNLEAWSGQYEWHQDEGQGLLDYVRPVSDTITNQCGDCEDYAAVVASALLAAGSESVGLVFCQDTSTIPWAGHVIAYDGTHTYSSGVIREQSPSEYLDESRYDMGIVRSLTQAENS